MNKKQIIDISTKYINDIISGTNYELVDIEYVKEGPFMYLRIYVDKEGGITIDDCSDISRAFNKKIDEIDFISEQYFLEVSSPGIERAFKREEDYIKNIGNEVEVKLFSPVNKVKYIKGILKDKKSDSITLDVNGNDFIIEIKNISKINQVIEFV